MTAFYLSMLSVLQTKLTNWVYFSKWRHLSQFKQYVNRLHTITWP